jgi:hypothetical protein
MSASVQYKSTHSCCKWNSGWFLENSVWGVASARDEGLIHSFLTPAGRPVAIEDIGHIAAELILQDWTGKRVVELQGAGTGRPQRFG